MNGRFGLLLASASAGTLGLLVPGTPLTTPALAWNYVTCASGHYASIDPGYPLEWSNPDCWHHGHVPTKNDDQVIINDDGLGEGENRFLAYEIHLTNQTMARLGKSSINLRTLIIGNNVDPRLYPDEMTDSILRVDGNQAVLQMSGDLTIGRNGGIGQMSVENGAYVWADNLYLGGYRDDDGHWKGGGSGNITVTGSGSIIQIHRDILAGVNGSGYIYVNNGGVLIANRDLNLHQGRASFDNGTVIVKGTLTIQPTPTNGGDDILNVSNGGRLAATVIHTSSELGPFAGALKFTEGTLVLSDLDGQSSTPATTIYGSILYSGGMTIAVDAALLDAQPDLVMHGSIQANYDWDRYGLTYTVTPSASGYAPTLDQRFTVVQFVNDPGSANAAAAPAVSGQSRLMFVDATASHENDIGYLTLTRNAAGFGDAAVTPSEVAIGEHLESLDSSHPLYKAFLGLPSSANVRDAYNALTGEIHSSGTAAVTIATRGAANVVQDHVAATFDLLEPAETGSSALGYASGPEQPAVFDSFDDMVLAGPAAWMQAYGTLSSLTDSAGSGTVNAVSGGVIFGGDVALNADTRAGLAVGYSRAGANHSSGLSQVQIDAFHALAYGGMRVEQLSFSGGIGVTASAINSTRQTGIPALPGNLNAAYGALTGQAFVEAAYEIDTGDFALKPYAGLALVSTYSQGHTETGGPAALTTDASLNTSLYTTIGIRAEQVMVLDDGRQVEVSGGIGWQHLIGDPTPDRSAQFANGSSVLALSGPALETDTLLLEAGVALKLSDALSLSLDYDAQLGLTTRNHTVKGTLRYEF